MGGGISQDLATEVTQLGLNQPPILYLLLYESPKNLGYFVHVQAGVPGLSLGFGGLGDKAKLVLCPISFNRIGE